MAGNFAPAADTHGVSKVKQKYWVNKQIQQIKTNNKVWYIYINNPNNKNRLINVSFFPFQKKYKDLLKFYHNSDVFILPSRFETWGLTINEAMSAGNAIISSEECGASYDLVKNNKNGFTFKNHDFKDLSKKIFLIYKHRNKINYFKINSLKIISKWGFKQCYIGLKKAINLTYKK